MGQFKKGDFVKINTYSDKWVKGLVEEDFGGYCSVLLDGGGAIYRSYNHLELLYPSDHDLLDFAARDSMVSELKAENEALKAELEKYKPKPKSITIDLHLYRNRNDSLVWGYGHGNDASTVARKTVTITEGEGM